MANAIIHALSLALMISGTAWSEPQPKNDSVVLYQVGRDGNYCVSITPNDKGCVSGSKQDGNTQNVLNFIKDKNVVFRNVSDAPHDMRITGANAQDLPAQFPNGGDAVKKMAVEDPSKQKITCSFHGNQLSVGYSVAPSVNMVGQGHKDMGNMSLGEVPMAERVNVNGGLGRVNTTGLADVSKEVIAKGRPAEVGKLLTARPELMGQLQQVRPLLAKEIGGSDAFGFAGGNKAGMGSGGGGGGGGMGSGFPNGMMVAKGGGGANGGFGGGAGGGAKGGAGSGGGGGGNFSATGLEGMEAMPSDMEGGPGGAGVGGRSPASATGTVASQLAGRKKGGNQTAMAPQTANLQGGAPATNRTKMKLANKPRRKIASQEEEGPNWLLLLLVSAALTVTISVILGTRSKKAKRTA